jgi:serine/threonine protein kinase
MSFAHSPQQQRTSRKRKNRIVAAKVELANFVDSGVIDGEASVLRFLDSALPIGMVPTFVDYVRHHGTQSLVIDNTNNIAIAPPPPIMSSSSLAGMAALTPMTPGAPSLGGGTSDGGLSAIIMECLPGEDMHLLRDRHCQEALGGADGSGTTLSLGGRIPRRLSVEDAVYLVADVMLPLLKAMHDVGIVHRDVKPSVSANRKSNERILISL